MTRQNMFLVDTGSGSGAAVEQPSDVVGAEAPRDEVLVVAEHGTDRAGRFRSMKKTEKSYRLRV